MVTRVIWFVTIIKIRRIRAGLVAVALVSGLLLKLSGLSLVQGFRFTIVITRLIFRLPLLSGTLLTEMSALQNLTYLY